MRPGLCTAAPSLLHPAGDGPADVGEGEAVGAAVPEADGEGVTGGTVGDGETGAELRDVREPAGVASLALQAVSQTTHKTLSKATGFMR
jgi:hypothetical protein